MFSHVFPQHVLFVSEDAACTWHCIKFIRQTWLLNQGKLSLALNLKLDISVSCGIRHTGKF